MPCEGDLYAVNRFVSSSFKWLGLKIGRHPLYFIIIPSLFTALMCLGILRLKVFDDTEYLFLPLDGKTVKARSEIERLFPENVTDFDVSHITRYRGSGVVVVTPKYGESMLNESIFEELTTLNEIIFNISVQWKGKTLTYLDICRKSNGKCIKNNVLSLKDKIEEIKSKNFKIRYPIEWNSNIVRHSLNLGGVSTDENHFVTDFKAVRLIYFVNYNNSTNQEISKLWEEKFLKIESHFTFKYINVIKMTGLSINIETNYFIENIIIHIIISGIITTIFVMVSCLSTDWATSKPLVGVCGCTSSLFGVISAFGILLICGMKFIEINSLIPFIVLGIGLDDSFVLLAAWRRTDYKDPVEKRLSLAYSEAAVSITITSLTNIICSLIGLTTNYKVIQIMSTYMALSMLMDYIFQVTFFGGCLAISGYAEAKIRQSVSYSPVRWNKNSGFQALMTCSFLPEKIREKRTTTNFYKEKLGRIISLPIVKFAIICIFLAYLSGAIYSLKYIHTSTDLKIYFSKKSYMIDYLQDDVKYFSNYRDRIQLLINKPLDYSNPEVQDKIEKFMIRLENSPYMAGSNLTNSWLRSYSKFIQNPNSWISLHGYNLSNPEDFVDALSNVFLKIKQFQALRKNIVFSANGKKILASRFFVQTGLLDSVSAENRMFSNMWMLTESSDLPIQGFNYRYVYYDQIFTSLPVVIQAISISSCLIILVFLIFIPSLFCAICIGFTIASIEVIVMGYMTIWGISINQVSMILLIVITGFCTDYSAHISYAYVNSKKNTSDEKIKDALNAAGHAIVQGCLSTIIGVALLVTAPYEFFVSVFKIFLIVIISAIFYGLFILPVLLSLWDDFRLYFKSSIKNYFK
ncbi:patched domain-containing protein 3-like [Centruroides vittatus]|uniref:patched domain-containing protein 3-like n=1 Tax=Centruroides vittatus TaxID=120091 RepID=UPI003510014B